MRTILNNDDRPNKETIQTEAMAIRFLMSLDDYEYHPGRQHSQSNITLKPCDVVEKIRTGTKRPYLANRAAPVLDQQNR